MGLMRLGLALVVLVFHAGYGGAGGPMAVYGFYVISGYLIHRVYVEKYQSAQGGLAAFYRNRFLRIVPLFLASSLLAYLALLVIDRELAKTLPLHGAAYLKSPGFSWADFGSGLKPQLVADVTRAPRVIAFFGWLPQFWTVSIELVFYLLAPVACLLRLRFGPRATWAILAACLAVHAAYVTLPAANDMGAYMRIVYMNAIPTLFFFAIGMALHELEPKVRARLPYGAAAASTMLVLALLLAGTRHLKTGLPPVPEYLLWQAVAVAGIIPVIFSRPSECAVLRRIDAFCADVGYGVYLNQSVTLVFWFAWLVAAGRTDYLSTPAAPYLVLAAATVALSWVTYVVIEAPCKRARARPGASPQAAQLRIPTPGGAV